MKLNAQEKITEKLYDDKGNEVYEEGYAPVSTKEEEGEEIALDEEYEFFDEDDDVDNEAKQKELSQSGDDFEEIDLEDMK